MWHLVSWLGVELVCQLMFSWRRLVNSNSMSEVNRCHVPRASARWRIVGSMRHPLTGVQVMYYRVAVLPAGAAAQCIHDGGSQGGGGAAAGPLRAQVKTQAAGWSRRVLYGCVVWL